MANVVIHNKLPQVVSISLNVSGTLTEVNIPPRGSHTTDPDNLTEYTNGLAARGYIRIRPVT